MIVGIFTGGFSSGWYGRGGGDGDGWNGRGVPGLIALSVLFTAIALLSTSHDPRGLYDFVIGMNRWALRVAAYASLMTDRYPPFRLEQGGDDPADADPDGTTSADP